MSTTLAAAVFLIALAGQDAAPPVQDPAPAQGPPPRKLELTFDAEGRVTLIASQVTVSEILAEWSRKGGTRIQGAERLTGGAIQIPIRFDNRPELEVIEALTRQAAGVSVAPRRVGAPGASRFESIHIVATSAATASSPYPSAPYGGGAPQPIRGFPDDEIPPVTAPGARDAQAPPQPQPGARTAPSAPGSPVIVPVVPVVPVGGPPTTPPAGGRGGGGGGTTTTTGRGGGGGGGGYNPTA
jgi:hypothetical protein